MISSNFPSILQCSRLSSFCTTSFCRPNKLSLNPGIGNKTRLKKEIRRKQLQKHQEKRIKMLPELCLEINNTFGFLVKKSIRLLRLSKKRPIFWYVHKNGNAALPNHMSANGMSDNRKGIRAVDMEVGA
ncbi:hypothetical protein NPIL_584281 [Nephila pilipes]|uniref:Uncharacterized protein n=1 Tax=Nephila pilipes TaxID=299642 RepID=A0A8X6MRA4_NEPPI|nr:hypothetical protein NPIL_584281 [Nephila pilipes]